MPDICIYSTRARENLIAAAAVASLLEQVSQTTDGANLCVNDLQDFLDADATLHIAEDRKTLAIAGFAATKFDGDQAGLFSVVALPSFRGLGIGGKVVDRAINDSVARGVTRINLEIRLTNAGLPIPALRVYESCGFKLLPGVSVVPIGHTHRDRHLWLTADPGGVFRQRHMYLALSTNTVTGQVNG